MIFAAASTVFSIAAPKIMSRAMNSLQESYMADTMLKELAKAQRAAVDAVNRHWRPARRGRMAWKAGCPDHQLEIWKTSVNRIWASSVNSLNCLCWTR